jgi:cation:H+ antiporter
MILYLLLIIAGFLMLYYGAEWLVKGSSSAAKSLGITPVVIGLTVVAFGTSAPEFVVSVISSVKQKSMIAVGNVIGSNICNIALVLGLVALFQPVYCLASVVRRDIPIMIGISLYLFVLTFDSTISRIEGATLFTGIIAYTYFNYYIARKEIRECGECSTVHIEKVEGYVSSRPRQILMILVGIAGVVAGAELVVDSAVYIMKYIGVDEKFIGLTIVAFGTSLPELATSVVAALRKELDISIGNLVGSNVFNILSVLGAASLVRPIPIPGGFFESGLYIDYSVMIFTSVLAWLMFRKDHTIVRSEGVILLTCYVGYLGYLIGKTMIAP